MIEFGSNKVIGGVHTDIPEGGAHDYSLVAELFVVVVYFRDGYNAWILFAFVRFLVSVGNVPKW